MYRFGTSQQFLMGARSGLDEAFRSVLKPMDSFYSLTLFPFEAWPCLESPSTSNKNSSARLNPWRYDRLENLVDIYVNSNLSVGV